MFTRTQLALPLLCLLAAMPAAAAPLVYPGERGAMALPDGPATAAIKRGFAALEADDLLAAETALREAMRIDPSAPGSYLGMAELVAQKAVAARIQGWADSPEIESWLRRAVEADPNGPMTLAVWARHEFRRGRATEAEAVMKRVVEISPSSTPARLQLADIQLRGLRNPQAAEATIRAAIERNRSQVETWMALAGTLVAQGRADDATAAFEQAAQVAPTEPEPLLALARYQASRLQVDAALATLERLVRALPATGQAYLDRGDLLLLKNDVAGAMSAYRQVLAVAPGAAVPAHFRLAAMHEGQQQWREAEAAYRAAIQLQPRFSAAYNNLAFMLASRNDRLDEALTLATRAVEMAPNEPAYVDTLGWVQRARGDLDAAARTLRRAVEMKPREATFHYHLGIVQAELGLEREAEASLRHVLDLDPNFRRGDDVRQRLDAIGARR
jgi:tetratricopeptide (TPR) repeat protein